jgi:hypothetical protein
MDGHHSMWSTGLGLQVYLPKIFSGLYVAKGKDETQALTRGLYKVKARERIASQQP